MIDAVCLSIVFLSFAVGLWRGFLKEVISLSAALLAAGGTVLLGGLAYPIVQSLVSHEGAARAMSFVVVFLLLFITFSIVGHLIKKKFIKDEVSLIDHVGGGLFGLTRGMLAVAMMGFFLVPFVPEETDWVQRSKTWPYLERGAEWLGDLAPTQLLMTYSRRQQDLFSRVLGSDAAGAVIRNPEIFKQLAGADLSRQENFQALRESVDRQALEQILQHAQAMQAGGEKTVEQLEVQKLEALLQLLNEVPQEMQEKAENQRGDQPLNP